MTVNRLSEELSRNFTSTFEEHTSGGDINQIVGDKNRPPQGHQVSLNSSPDPAGPHDHGLLAEMLDAYVNKIRGSNPNNNNPASRQAGSDDEVDLVENSGSTSKTAVKT